MELTDAQIEAANEQGRIAQASEPRAASARYDVKAGRIVVDLTSGATFAFPPELVQGLCDATPEQLAEIETSPSGYGLHWPQLDKDCSRPGSSAVCSARRNGGLQRLLLQEQMSKSLRGLRRSDDLVYATYSFEAVPVENIIIPLGDLRNIYMTFDELISEGFTAIEKMVFRGTDEGPQLDFKRKADPKRLDLQKDDRKALGEAASGFANAMGGILVIGVGTEDSNGLDKAKSIEPIDEVEAVADRYLSYLSECVTPPLVGANVVALRPDGSQSGVILVYIPKSEARPHMSIAPTHHRFYRRVSDRFQQMERYEIEEMFNLRKSPRLELIINYQSGGSIGGNPHTYITFGLKNNSNSSAKFPYISIHRPQNSPRLSKYGLDGNGGTIFKKLATGSSEEILFSGGSDIVIHPEQSIIVSRFEYLQNYEERINQYWCASTLGPQGFCEILFSFGCEDYPRQTVSAKFSSAALLNFELPIIEKIM